MKKSCPFWIPLILGAVLAQPASAQRIDSPYRFLDHSQFLGGFGGYTWLSDGRIGLGPEPAPLLGVGWSIRVSGPFAVALDIGYMPTTRVVRDTAFVAADSTFQQTGESDVRLVTAMANLRFNLTGARTWHGVQPFALLGAGAAVDFGGGSAADLALQPNMRFDMGTSFAGQLGAGIDWFPSSRVSIRLDARNMLWKLDVPEAFRLTDAGRELPGSEWEQNFALAAGLSIHF